MVELINRYLRNIFGINYTLDPRIPKLYLFSLILTRLMMLIRGYFTFCKNDGLFFRDKNSVIKGKSKIRFGRNVTIGRNCFIDALSVYGITTGNNVSIGKNTTIECSGSIQNIGHGIRIGNGVGLGTHGFFGCAGGIEIGDNTILGNYVSMHSENHNFSDIEVPIKTQGVNRAGIKIGEDCWIGAKVTILDGANVENGCIIAAGSVLTDGIYDSYGVYGGIPARLLKKRS